MNSQHQPKTSRFRFRSFGLKTKLLCAAIIPLAGSALIMLVGLNKQQEAFRSGQLVHNSHRLIRTAMKVEKNAVDMNTGMRGFLLTGDQAFLGPYNKGQQAVSAGLAELRGEVAGFPEQLKLLNQVEQIIKEWQEKVAQKAIGLRREIGDTKDLHDVAKLVSESRGDEIFDEFRDLTGTILAEEQQTIAQRQAEAAQSLDSADFLSAVQAFNRSLSVIQTTQELYATAAEMQSMIGQYLLLGDSIFLKAYELSRDQLFTLLQQLRQTVAGNADQEKQLDRMKAVLEDWVNTAHAPLIETRKEMASSKTMNDLKEFVARGDDKKYFDRFREKMEAFKQRQDDLLAQRARDVAEQIKSTHMLMYAGMAAIIPLTLLIFFVLARNITRPLAQAAVLAEEISRGEISSRLDVKTEDEVGRLSRALNDMADMITLQVSRVIEGVNVLTSSVSEISTSISQLAAGTRETSAAVTETSTTVEEVKQAARVSGEKAKHVSQTSLESVKTAQEGRSATEGTIEGMRQIREQMQSIGETVVRLSDHSRAIDDIMDVVKDLAEQSNLLAVNASIEAARAGDQGKGFAVVAQEIKTLAEQSEEATQQVRGILEETRKWVNAVVMASEQGSKVVDTGVTKSNQAEESIRKLAETVNVASQAASVIDQSAEQQSVGVEQVSTAMTSIDDAMHRNLESTAQLEVAAKRLEELGAQLKGMVAGYKF